MRILLTLLILTINIFNFNSYNLEDNIYFMGAIEDSQYDNIKEDLEDFRLIKDIKKEDLNKIVDDFLDKIKTKDKKLIKDVFNKENNTIDGNIYLGAYLLKYYNLQLDIDK